MSQGIGITNPALLIGQKFGFLTVTSVSEQRVKKQKFAVECTCECGGSIIVGVSSLVRGRNKSCGCLRTGPEKKSEEWYKRRRAIVKKYRKKHPDSIAKLLRAAKTRAKDKGIEFCLKPSDIVIPARCPIFPEIELKRGEGKRTEASPSIDRIDPTKGYIKDNVWIISWRANRIKNDASVDELERIASAVRLMIKNTALLSR